MSSLDDWETLYDELSDGEKLERLLYDTSESIEFRMQMRRRDREMEDSPFNC